MLSETQAVKLPDRSVIASLARFEVQRHRQQLFNLDNWQHCYRLLKLLCLPADSQLTFLATAHTFETQISCRNTQAIRCLLCTIILAADSMKPSKLEAF